MEVWNLRLMESLAEMKRQFDDKSGVNSALEEFFGKFKGEGRDVALFALDDWPKRRHVCKTKKRAVTGGIGSIRRLGVLEEWIWRNRNAKPPPDSSGMVRSALDEFIRRHRDEFLPFAR